MVKVYKKQMLLLRWWRWTGNRCCCYNDRGEQETDAVARMMEVNMKQMLLLQWWRQSWARVFKITSRLAPVHLFQTVSHLALLRIFQQKNFASLAFCVIAHCISEITSRCFCVGNFRGCNFLRLFSYGLPSCTDEILISDVNSHKTSLANIICA